jgi:DNA excision repair protein ERCC-5
MGVTGLWTVVAPTARPTQLATLNRKRLAVDASIWIYQFLKAVRDKEGNALRNSHVVGFFRRICKLLYFGIKPVFVFDGGAPLLKRETVRGRARRREGRREDAARTAGKLLGMQMQKVAEEEEKKRKADRERTPEQEEELPPEEEMVYADELGMSKKERLQSRQFKKKDQYHLPDLDISIESMGAPNDPRIMSQAELEEYARQFHSGEDINLYDFSKIDFESPFFLSLPASDRYNILNAARLRSRLRMGYSKEQLDDMFPDRMAFSRFQIERVRERNELTQRLMHVNGMAEDFLDQGGRIAGEKGKEYVLVKNEGVEGGWALGVVSNKGGREDEAINLDEEVQEESEEELDNEDDFEDVAIEGLNRLPKRWARNRKEADYNLNYRDAAEEIAQKRRAVYEARQKTAAKEPIQPQHEAEAEDALFVQDGSNIGDEEVDELFEDVDMDKQDDEDDLQRAVQMSLQRPESDNVSDNGVHDLFTMENREKGRLIAKNANQRNARGGQQAPQNADDLEGGFDLQAALAESRRSKHQPKSRVGISKSPPQATDNRFDGPLPFESLNLGQSLLGKKKADRLEQDQAGGFEKETDNLNKKAAPLPSWFAAKTWQNETGRDDANEEEDDHITFGPEDVDRRAALMRRSTQDVIDVDEPSQPKPSEPIVLDSSDDETDLPREDNAAEVASRTPMVEAISQHAEEKASPSQEKPSRSDGRLTAEASEPAPLMDNVADLEQEEPPKTDVPNFIPKMPGEDDSQVPLNDEEVEWSETDDEDLSRVDASNDERRKIDHNADQVTEQTNEAEEDEEFEDVDVSSAQPPTLQRQDTSVLNEADVLTTNRDFLTDEGDVQQQLEGTTAGNLEDEFSDSDEELMRQMAIEAEEHARFASSLNNARTTADAVRDYEKELKQLRNQQKKDRRDADEVTQVMVQECQALLRLFGLPYITAPMEAEAQCAELVSLGLVDGIVTDDSDIFLFGGTRVYKNMFNAAKFVECYLTTDLEKEYALDRQKLIRFAHLLGSDYTEGIPGVGPVTALEILTEFETLEAFRDWCAKIQMGQFDGNVDTPFRRKFRKQALKMFLPPAFPDTRVDHAYLHPDVDDDSSGFEWGVPDLDALRAFLMATIGWSQERTDEVLVPVIRDMNKRGVEGTQANITRFFGGGVGVGGREAAAPRNRGVKSGRMEKAFGRLKSAAERKKRGEVDGVNGMYAGAEDNSEAAQRASKRRGRKIPAKDVSIEEDRGDTTDSDLAVDKTPKKRRRSALAG